jgi:hypothetical protein
MKRNKVSAIILTMMLVGAGLLVFPVSFVGADPVFKQIVGVVDPNATTGVRAYDANPPDNGWTFFYIQNRTNEGTGTDDMIEVVVPPTYDIYDPEIYVDVSDWQVGDQCINVINRDFGTYGVDHAGYVAFTNTTLSPTPGADSPPTTELIKIPTPVFTENGPNYINMSWPAVNDPYGLVAGYVVYRSDNNGTVSGDAEWVNASNIHRNNPITGTTFNDTTVVQGNTYYYSIKVVTIGYANNNPGSLDNYECAYFGEGSGQMQPEAPPLSGVDYIVITNAPDGTPYTTEPLPIGGTLTAYASGYNNTGPTYIKLVEVAWSGPGGSWAPGTGTSSVFTAGTTPGTYTQTGENVSMPVSDTFMVDILTPTVDYIIITDAPDGTALGTVDLPVGGTVTAYASGYNNTGALYVGLVEVTWTGPGGGWSPGTGTSSTYTAGLTGGLFTQTGENVSMPVSDTFNVNILPPTVDYVLLTDAPDGTELTTENLPIGGTVTAFASGYNTTSNYVGLVEVTWTDNGGSWSPSQITVVHGLQAKQQAPHLPQE